VTTSVSTLPVLAAAPEFAARTETVDVPELGGALLVRGLMASEVFAISGVRSQALRRLREARAEHAQAVAALPDGATPPEFEAPVLDFDELKQYGKYISQLLACSVTLANGLAAYTAAQWEVVGQHHPGVPARLQRVAERLSGLDEGDVEKN
jgi:hypothetical protein